MFSWGLIQLIAGSLNGLYSELFQFDFPQTKPLAWALRWNPFTSILTKPSQNQWKNKNQMNPAE